MKYSCKEKKNNKIVFLIISLILSIEIKAQYTSINNLNGSFRQVKTNSEEKNSQSNNQRNFEGFKFKSESGTKEGEDANVHTINCFITEDAKKPPLESDKEVEIFPKVASAGTEYSWGFMFWSFLNFGANNALSGHHGYWLSKRDVQHDHWEADFNTVVKLDLVQIHWRLPPTRFKIFYKIDLKQNWIAASDVFNKLHVRDEQGNIISSGASAEYNTIYFTRPLFCKKFRIMMNEPIKKKSFSINSVSFYSRRNTGLMKLSMFQSVRGEFCWFVNTDKPREGSLIVAYPCIGAISMGLGFELFHFETNGQIRLINTSLCVGYSEGTKELMLKECGESRSAYVLVMDFDHSFYFAADKSLSLYMSIQKNEGFNLIGSSTEIMATSEMDKNEHKKENIVLSGNNYWASSPGQNDVTIQLLFGKISCEFCREKDEYEAQKVDLISINWVHNPKRFSVYIWRPGYSWKNVGTYSDYSSKVTQISIISESISGIMIHMTEGYKNQDFNNEVVYSIQSIFAGFEGYKFKLGNKKTKDISLKFFDFETQHATVNSQTLAFHAAFKMLGITQEKLIGAYRMLKGSLGTLAKLKRQGNGFCEKIFGFNAVIGNKTIKNLIGFKNEIKKITNPRFLEFLRNFREVGFLSRLGIRANASISGASILNSYNLQDMMKPSNNIRFGIGGLGITNNSSINGKANISASMSIKGGIGGSANIGSSGKSLTSFGSASISAAAGGSASMGVKLGLSANAGVSAGAGLSIEGGVSAKAGLSFAGGVSAKAGLSVGGGLSAKAGLSAGGGLSSKAGISAGLSAGVGTSAKASGGASVGANLSVGASIGGISVGASIGAKAGFSFKSKEIDEDYSTNNPSTEESETSNYIKYKSKLGDRETPAENCLELKRHYPKVLSGYYYIKSECSPKKIRVFCDFSIYKDVVDFYIFKDDSTVPNPDLGYLEIKNVENIKYLCATKGLYPITIEHKDIIERMYQLLVLDGYDLSGANFIPIGYDYSCKNKKCSGIYNSLSFKSSLPINQFFSGNIDEADSPGPFVGFGLKSEPRVINFDIEKVKVSGLVCSTNTFGNKDSADSTKTISCEMNTSTNTEIFSKNDVIVRCPKGCDQVNSPVYGTGLYHGDSAICKAAIHNGVINGNGGKIKVVMQTIIQLYNGSHQNGIASTTKRNDGVRPFIIMKYIPKCPIDKFKERTNKSKRGSNVGQNIGKDKGPENQEDDKNSKEVKDLESKTSFMEFNNYTGSSFELQKMINMNTENSAHNNAMKFIDDLTNYKSEEQSQNNSYSNDLNSRNNRNNNYNIDSNSNLEKTFMILNSLKNTANSSKNIPNINNNNDYMINTKNNNNFSNSSSNMLDLNNNAFISNNDKRIEIDAIKERFLQKEKLESSEMGPLMSVQSPNGNVAKGGESTSGEIGGGTNLGVGVNLGGGIGGSGSLDVSGNLGGSLNGLGGRGTGIGLGLNSGLGIEGFGSARLGGLGLGSLSGQGSLGINAGLSGQATGGTTETGLGYLGLGAGGSISAPNYSAYFGKQIDGQYGASGMWDVASFMGKGQIGAEAGLSGGLGLGLGTSIGIGEASGAAGLKLFNTDNILMKSAGVNIGLGGAGSKVLGNDAAHIEAGLGLGYDANFINMSGAGAGIGIGLGLGGSAGFGGGIGISGMLDLSAQSKRKEIGEITDTMGAGASSITASSASLFAAYSVSGKMDSSRAFKLILKIFSSGIGRYMLRLRDRLKLITRFVEEFKSKFSSTINFAINGCSLANMDAQLRRIVLIIFKISELIRRLGKSSQSRIAKTKNLMMKWKSYLHKLKAQDPVTINYSKFSSNADAKAFIFGELFKVIGGGLKTVIIDINPDEKQIDKNTIEVIHHKHEFITNVNWDIHTLHIKDKKRAIGLVSKARSPVRLAATMIHLINKEYFDFKFESDILFKSQGVGGIAFRVKDEFNYYAFIIDKILGYKAIAKVQNNKVILLKTVNDGGILINNWHTVSITVRAGLISVYIYDKESAQRTTSEKRLEVEDYTFTNGSVGFFVNGLEGFFFDEFKITPIKCFSAWQPIPFVEINNNFSNIYYEDFSGSFNSKYTIIDIEESYSQNGPAKWDFVNDDIQLSFISQNSFVSDTSGKKRPSMALINYVNFANGIFQLEFMPFQREGMVSIILKYSRSEEETGPTREEFYSFDMHNEETESYFTFRKWTNGISIVLKRYTVGPIDGLGGVKMNSAYLEEETNIVIVESINNKFTIKISQDGGDTFVTIVNILDESFKAGAVGFGTFKTRAYFKLIQVDPPRLKLTQKDIDWIITKTYDDIPLPSVTHIHSASVISNCTKNKKFNELTSLSTTLAYSGILGSVLGHDYCSSNTKYTDVITSFDNQIEGGWKKCVMNRSHEDRKKYCQETFDSEILQQRCLNNFCNTCCDRNIGQIHSNVLHTCKKTCYKSIVSADQSKDYVNVCINSLDTKSNIYDFCQTRMVNYNKSLMAYCKLDMCNLCCVSIDKIKKQSYSFTNMRSCFNDCSKEYNLDGITIIKNKTGEEQEENLLKKLEEDYINLYNDEDYSDITSIIKGTNSTTIDINQDTLINKFFPNFPNGGNVGVKGNGDNIPNTSSSIPLSNTNITSQVENNIDLSTIESLTDFDKPKKKKKVIDEVIVNENTEVIKQEENVDIIDKNIENKIEVNNQQEEINNLKVTDQVNIINEN